MSDVQNSTNENSRKAGFESNDSNLKLLELQLKVDEFKHKKEMDERASRASSSPLTTAVIGGVIAVLATVIGGVFNSIVEQQRASKELELKQRDAQLQLILRATQDRTKRESAENLHFFVEVGLLEDRDGKIRAQLAKSSVPAISSGAERRVLRPCEAKAFGSALRAKIATAISQHLDLECKRLLTKARLSEDLKADDLEVFELPWRVSDATGVDIPQSDADKMKTIEDYFIYVEKRVPVSTK